MSLLLIAYVVHKLQEGHLSHLLEKPSHIICLVLLLPLIPVFKILSWHRLTQALGIALPLRKTFKACFLSMVGRYIPGKVFFVVGRVTPYGPNKQSLLMASGGMIIEFAMEFLAGFLLLLIALFCFGISHGLSQTLVITAMVTSVCILVLAHPFLLNICLKFALKFIKKDLQPPVLSFKDMMSVVALIMGHWLV
ncbi:MAG: hypothetical protein HQL32_16470, partial [Planctomycetes bacterium]|nr:hypothetical protein [Planctomycetota bacterium]